ncbi:MAG: DUF779 domain-containing protein [Myxococcota bacterium]
MTTETAKSATPPASHVHATESAQALIADLMRQHGPPLFHQSSGCCDGSSPMCYPQSGFKVGVRDVLLGEVGGQTFYVGQDELERWSYERLTLDAAPGRAAGFSLEGSTGMRFVTRSELCSVR